MTLEPSAVVPSQALVVGDHPLFREGLAIALVDEPDLKVIAGAATAGDAVDALRGRPVDIVVVDITTTGRSLETLLGCLPQQCKVLTLAVFPQPNVIAAALRAGAHGYALKSQPITEITNAMRVVLNGRRYVPPSVSEQAVMQLLQGELERPLTRLTTREREVFELLIRGLTNDEIATELAIARRTVETHRQRISKKLATNSVIELAQLAAWHWAMFD